MITYQKWSNNIKVQFDNRLLLSIDKKDLRNYYLIDTKCELKDSSWVYLYDSGAIFGKGTYDKGYRVGAWQFFHENGVIAQRGFYRNNGTRFHGNDEDAYLWKVYNEEGIEVEHQDYNENWIEEAEEYLAAQKERWSWVDYEE
jgi:antitoxin component YwqK of YwqJK toxin-antitoxin module